MTIQIGDTLPDSTLFESTGFGDLCPLPPEKISVSAALKGKRIVIFGLPGAFTPPCSGKHLPGFVEQFGGFKAKGIDEVWCVAVNDGYVMAVWGKEMHAAGKIRMLGDGSAEWVRKLGVEFEIPGMGVRSRRFSMLVDNGVVKHLNLDAPGKFEVSDAATLIKQLT